MDEGDGLSVGFGVAVASLRALAAFLAASVVLLPASLAAFLPLSVAPPASEPPLGDGSGFGAEVVGAGVGLVVVGAGVGSVFLPPPSSPLSRSPRPSGSSGLYDEVGLAVGVGAVVAVDLVSLAALSPEALGLALGDGLSPSGLADGEGVPEPSLAPSLPVDPDFASFPLLSVFLASLVSCPLAVGDGVSDWETHAPGAKDGVEGSSAWARCGVRPMPISTAVGIAASATAFPAGTCSLVSSDLRGAAWRGPEVALTRGPSLVAG